MESQQGDLKKRNTVAPGGLESSVPIRVARRAYELYLKRGGIDGHEVEDWLQAEREILKEETC